MIPRYAVREFPQAREGSGRHDHHQCDGCRRAGRHIAAGQEARPDPVDIYTVRHGTSVLAALVAFSGDAGEIRDASFTHFMYQEDDMLVRRETVAYHLESREFLRSAGMLPGILRVEQR